MKFNTVFCVAAAILLNIADLKVDILQEVQIQILDNINCSTAFPFNITNNLICDGLLTEGGKGQCMINLGSPLVSKQGSKWIQSGVLFHARCDVDHPQYPGVFIRVSEYQDWINSHTSSNQPGVVSFHSLLSGGESSLNLLSSFFTVTFSIISLVLCLFL